MLVRAPPFTLQDYNQKCLQSLQNIPWGEGVAKPLSAGNQGSSTVLLMMKARTLDQEVLARNSKFVQLKLNSFTYFLTLIVPIPSFLISTICTIIH